VREGGHGSRGWLKVSVVAFLVFAYFMPRWADWNIDSRFDLTAAIVNHHTLSIDAYHQNTWDKAYYRGHYYSDKAPGTAMLGVPVYAAFETARSAPLIGTAIRSFEANKAFAIPIQEGKRSTQSAPAKKGTDLGGCQRQGMALNVQVVPWGNRLVPDPTLQDWALAKYVTTVGTVDLLSAFFAGFFFWFLGFFLAGRLPRLLLTGLFAFATVALPYSTVYYSHELSAAFLFGAFALLYLRGRSLIGSWAPAAAGFLLGFAFFTEYTVALIVFVIGAYGLWLLRKCRREIVAYVAAGAVPVAALFAYNWAIFRNPLDTGYSHDFCWSPAQGAGFAGFTYPHLGPLLDLTILPYRGLFFQSPFLLLAVPGLVLMWRRGLRAEMAACAISGAIFILAISAFWGWNGGRVDGPRYLVPSVPFLAFPVLFYLVRADSAWRKTVAVVLGVISLVYTWLLFLGGTEFPISWLRYPLWRYSLPALSRNEVAPNVAFFLGLRGWESLIPLAVIALLGMLWVWPCGSAQPVRAAPTRLVHSVDV